MAGVPLSGWDVLVSPWPKDFDVKHFAIEQYIHSGVIDNDMLHQAGNPLFLLPHCRFNVSSYVCRQSMSNVLVLWNGGQ